jgi:dolichyl-phosphate-mannose--protein O-mannosyl transferase
MLAGSVVIFFVIGRISFTRPVAYVATAFYAFNPAILVNGRRGMMEGAMLLGGLSVVALGVWMATHQSNRWRIWESAVLGGVAGVALACKHTNLVFVGAVFVGLGLQAIWQLDPQTTHRTVQVSEYMFSGWVDAPEAFMPSTLHGGITPCHSSASVTLTLELVGGTKRVLRCATNIP